MSLERSHTISDTAPGCPVESAQACVAMREGRAIEFDSSEQIDACPKLRGRLDQESAASCVPVTILGKPSGVLHLTAPTSVAPPPTDEAVRVLTAAGARLGLIRALSESRRQADTDPLTGLANRRVLEARLSDYTEHAMVGKECAVLMLDLDHFKDLNDTYGHEIGNRALQLFADVLRQTTRPGDLSARYGGEEFVCVLQDATIQIGQQAAERIQRTMSQVLADSALPLFTVSIGIAITRAGVDAAQALLDADGAMYAAKSLGRNRVEIAPSHATSLRLELPQKTSP